MYANYRLIFIAVLLVENSVPTTVYEESGDYIIGGLLPVHEENCWKLRELETLHRLEAMAFAVRQINNRSDILPNITLGFRIYDTCSYEPTTVAHATLFVPVANLNLGVTCEDQLDGQKPVIGVVGTEKSSTTLAAAQLFSVYKIPLVSFFATADDLSDIGRYPFFLRTVPSDKLQVQAMIDILKYFGWTYVSIIYSGDSYGRNALNSFRQQLIFSPNICLGVEFEIDSDTLQLAVDVVITAILARAETAKVVIMFTQANHANDVLTAMRRLGAQGKIQIIGSDGWGMSIGEIEPTNREMARGAIKTQLPDEEVQEFEDYFIGLIRAINNTLPGHNNPWLCKFRFQYGLDCIVALGCDMVYGRAFSESSGVSRVIDAVKIYAYGLDDMVIDYCLKTTNSSPPCNVSEMVVTGEDLFKRMIKVILPWSRYRTMFSHAAGEVMKERYELEVIRESGDEREYELVRIGEWQSMGKPDELNITETNIPWGVSGDGGEYKQPSSYCSKPCDTGHIATGIGDRECCWQCTPCASRDIVVNGTVCTECSDQENPDESREKCVPVEPLYIRWKDPTAIVLTVITCLGILTTCLTFTGYLRSNYHPLIKASSRELSYLMLVGVFLSYGLVFSFFGQPTVGKCYIIRDGFMMGFTFTYAPLLTRANRIYRIFWAGKRSAKRPSFISPRSQIIIALVFIMIQLVISISWQINNSPAPVVKVPKPGEVEIMCNINDGEMIISLSYNVILVLLCSVHAFMTHKVPNNYNESRFISLSVYTTLVIWLAFIPCYFLLPGAVVQLVVMAVALIISGTITLAFMFFPKLYAVHFVSEDNVHAAGTYRDRGSLANGNGISSGDKPVAVRRDVGGTARSLILRGSSVAPAAVTPTTQIGPRDEQVVKEETMRQRCFHSLATQVQNQNVKSVALIPEQTQISH